MKESFKAVAFARDFHTKRWEAKLSVRDVAQLCGCSHSTICYIENGRQQPKVGLFLLLCFLFDLNPNDYVVITANPEHPFWQEKAGGV